MTELEHIHQHIVRCRRCPRLIQWCRDIARKKTKRFVEWDYWGRPIPGFGDPKARLLLVGLAPAAHGGNRTGRMFTGDRSGDWLYRALHKAGFANQPTSVSRDDGMKLRDCYITASCRCAPPLNKPLPEELENCRPFLLAELRQLKRVRVIVGLGKTGFDSAVASLYALGRFHNVRKLRFGHGVEYNIDESLTLLGSFHPSQQNTFTGRLTEPMFDSVFARARALLRRESE